MWRACVMETERREASRWTSLHSDISDFIFVLDVNIMSLS